MKKLLFLAIVLSFSTKFFAMVPTAALLIKEIKIAHLEAELKKQQQQVEHYDCNNIFDATKALVHHRVHAYNLPKVGLFTRILYVFGFGAPAAVGARAAFYAACPHDDCDTTQTITYSALSTVAGFLSLYFGVTATKDAIASYAAEKLQKTIDEKLNNETVMTLLDEPSKYQENILTNVIKALESKEKTKPEKLIAQQLVKQLRKDIETIKQELKQVSREMPQPV